MVVNFSALAKVDLADIRNRFELEKIFGDNILATKDTFEPSKYADSYEEMVTFAVVGLRLKPVAKLLHAMPEIKTLLDPSVRPWWLIDTAEATRLWKMHAAGGSLAMFMELASILDRAMRDMLNLSGALKGGKPPVKFYDLMKLPFFQSLWGVEATVMINVFLGTMEGMCEFHVNWAW